MIKYLPLLLLPLLLIFVFTFVPVKRVIVYRLGISGDKTTSCCNIDTIVKSGDFDESSTTAIFNGQIIDYPKRSLAEIVSNKMTEPVVLAATTDEKWIEVSLDQQKVRAWEGNKIVMEFPISSGRWFPTPKGDFRIWYKTRLQRMTGGSKELETFYDLPNVPHNMFFYGGFALHGAYWHNNFGNPMSHGCVNEPLPQAAQIFEWANPVVPTGQNYVRATSENPGTRVFVH